MGKYFAALSRKGPGGIPMWGYAIGTAIVVYVAYRHFAGRGSKSSASSPADSGSAPIDTSVGTPDYYTGSAPPSSQQDPANEPTTDTTPPDSTSTTAPPASDSTSALTTAIEKLTKQLQQKNTQKKKKGHKTPHDHKQGTPHTKHKAVHKKHRGNHAPKKKGKPTAKAAPARTRVKFQEMSFQAPGSGYELAKSAPVKRRPIPIANVPRATPRPPLHKRIPPQPTPRRRVA